MFIHSMKKNIKKWRKNEDFSSFDLEMTLTLTFHRSVLYIILKYRLGLVIFMSKYYQYLYTLCKDSQKIFLKELAINGGHLRRHLGFLCIRCHQTYEILK